MCEDALELNPDFRRAYSDLRRIYETMGDYEQAVDTYEKAQTLRDGDTPSLPFDSARPTSSPTRMAIGVGGSCARKKGVSPGKLANLVSAITPRWESTTRPWRSSSDLLRTVMEI